MARDSQLNNVIGKKLLREIQLETLEHCSNVVMNTAGPFGANTMLTNGKEYGLYTKDGKNVLDKIQYNGQLECAIADELTQLASLVVRNVGDGTTSAVRLSYLIFKGLLENEKNWEGVPDRTILDSFNKVVGMINEEIRSNGTELELQEVYDICMISTNGDKDVSRSIAKIYEKFGKEVYIELGTSVTQDDLVKEYDGLVLSKGMASPAFANNLEGDKCSIRDPKIYYFQDPVDTPEMVNFMGGIIAKNITAPGMTGSGQFIPTVILVPHLSRDAQAYIKSVEEMISQRNDIPLLIITQLNDRVDSLDDLSQLLGAKPIKKYIDPKLQEIDIQNGNAPTMDTIFEWCGSAELVEADASKTKFINPINMYVENEEGELVESDTLRGLTSYLKGAIETAIAENEDYVTIGKLKRRLNTLKASMVEYLVGGVSNADRQAARDAAEDAILNCRAAAQHGVGYASGLEGYMAADRVGMSLFKGTKEEKINFEIAGIIREAYAEYITSLYKTVMMSDEEAKETLVKASRNGGVPFNLRTREFDRGVISSINTDITILEGVSKVITSMYASNQAILDSVPNTFLYREVENKKINL